MDQLPLARGRDPLALAPRYRQLQEQAPVSQVRTRAGDVAWLVCGYDEVKTLTGDRRLGRSHPDPARAAKINDSALQGVPRDDHQSEQDTHRRMRRLLAPAFSAKRMAALRTHVGDLIDTVLANLPAPPLDLQTALSEPLPVMVICELLGAPYTDHPRLRDWSDRLGGLADPASSIAASREFLDYTRTLLETKRRDPGDDVFSDLACDDTGLKVEQSAQLAMGLLFAGHETTLNRISMGTLLLLSNPDQRDRLDRDPSLMRGAVEEILRMSGSNSANGDIVRYAASDIGLGAVTIPAGDAVLLAYGAANRDRRAFERPDEFDITRSPNPHLGFGHGAHFCVGASLARIELQEAFSRLFARIPTLRLAVPYDQLELHADRITGGLTALPVTW